MPHFPCSGASIEKIKKNGDIPFLPNAIKRYLLPLECHRKGFKVMEQVIGGTYQLLRKDQNCFEYEKHLVSFISPNLQPD